LLGQLEQLPALAEVRSRNAALLTGALGMIDGIHPLPPQPSITREAIYNYVFQYCPQDGRVSRDLFVAALDAEGIPSDGRFYEPVYRSDLFRVTADDYPQLKLDRDAPVDYAQFHCPVSERAAYREAVWLPQFLLLGNEEEVADIVCAVEKVMANLDRLSAASASLAGQKAMSRAERPRVEREKNY
jgi:dTDP-4-amino-4,6-dideoxygalactose transaminase